MQSIRHFLGTVRRGMGIVAHRGIGIAFNPQNVFERGFTNLTQNFRTWFTTTRTDHNILALNVAIDESLSSVTLRPAVVQGTLSPTFNVQPAPTAVTIT